MTVSTTARHARRANRLLAAGAAIGIALATSGLLQPTAANLSTQAVARVGQDRIAKQDYLAYLELLARDKRNPLTAADQRHVLTRMIDEKLLLARGLEIGLPQSSPQVRKAIVQELIQSILAEVSSEAFDDVELRQFYQDNMAYFTSPPRTQLRRLVFRDRGETSAQALAEEGWQQLQQGQSFARVRERFAAEDPLPLPAEPLPDHKLLQYLGPSQTAIARQMQAGAYSRPIAAGANRVILQVLHKQAMAPGAFADIRDRVAAEYERRRGDQALAAYLQQLRQQADIAIDDAFLDSIAPAPPTSAAEN